MPAPRRRIVSACATAAAVAIVLAGCAPAAVSPDPQASYKGEPKGVKASAASAGGAPWAAWMDAKGDRFAVTLYGSPDCPPYATGYKVVSPDEITMKLAKAADACADGYTPYTTVFETPPSLDREVTIQFTAQDTHFYLAPIAKK
jgi:hypothetical protein